MAKRLSLSFTSDTEDGKVYVKDYIRDHTPDGFDMFKSGMGFTVYASNLFNPEFEKYIVNMVKDISRQNLSCIITAFDGYEKYELSKDGAFSIGEMVIVGYDDDGLGPITEYQKYDNKRPL